nr:hypothetical protein [Aeromonas simiae]
MGRGHRFPLGCALCGGGVNFAIWARLTCEVELLLLVSAEDDPRGDPPHPRA